jgi:hypothetical protein
MDESNLLNLKVANQALFNTVRYQVSQGAQGPEGPTGAAGPAGSATNTGATGSTGIPGYATNTGATGATGSVGTTGATGIPGYATTTGATGIQGAQGTAGLNGTTGHTGAQGPPGGETGYKGPTGDPGPPGSGGSSTRFGVIKVPSSTANFNFVTAVSTLPSSFGTYNPGSATDALTFTITLNSSYGPTNLPFYNLTAYVYSTTAGYINCQRQLGAQSGVAAASITMNAAVTTITFNYINKTNFPYTSNDSAGYALYICFNIIN